MPIWLVALINILVGGAVILTYALFHHVLPAINSAREQEEAMLHATQPPVIATEAPAPAPTPTEAPVEGSTAAPTEPDPRTEWQKKFAEHFSDEIIRTENSYKSPNVSITLETVSYGEGRNKQTYHVADIYIASIENFTTYTANGEMRYFATQDVLEMNEASNAILSISGDFLTYQNQGFLMRNGVVYQDNSNLDSICVLFADGTMETYDERTYDIQELKDRGAVQVWSFGPVLLDENGMVREKYKMPTAVSYPNPRSAIGYYEPGHYCFVVVDGRQNHSAGVEIAELAHIFEKLGCKAAYNLDGGATAVMMFNQQRYSKPSNGGRDLGDILMITEAGYTKNPKTEEASQ
jgi:exopolysaccharide biosynthesis protein